MLASFRKGECIAVNPPTCKVHNLLSHWGAKTKSCTFALTDHKNSSVSVRDGWSLWSLVRSGSDAVILVCDICSWYKLSSCWLYLHIYCRDDISLYSHPDLPARQMYRCCYGFVFYHFHLKIVAAGCRTGHAGFRNYSTARIKSMRGMIQGSAAIMTKCHNQRVKEKVLLNKAIISQYFTAPNSTQWSSWGKDNRDAGKHALQQQTAQEEIESWPATEATG